MNCNNAGNCPYRQPYYGPPYPIQTPIPMISQPAAGESIPDYCKRVKRELKDLEETFKTEVKKDDKKKKETFTFAETAAMLILLGPLVAILQMKLFNYVLATLTVH